MTQVPIYAEFNCSVYDTVEITLWNLYGAFVSETKTEEGKYLLKIETHYIDKLEEIIEILQKCNGYLNNTTELIGDY